MQSLLRFVVSRDGKISRFRSFKNPNKEGQIQTISGSMTSVTVVGLPTDKRYSCMATNGQALQL